MRSASDARPAGERVGEDGRVEQASPERGELKITQDLVPTGLGLMPRWMAQRIAQMVSRHASNHV
jgi:hypothetical protein